MIWVRRLLAIPLSLLFMWLLIVGLLLIHLEGSLLSPEFIRSNLRRRMCTTSSWRTCPGPQ